MEPQRGVTLCQGKVPGWVHPQGLSPHRLGEQEPFSSTQGQQEPCSCNGPGNGAAELGVHCPGSQNLSPGHPDTQGSLVPAQGTQHSPEWPG